MFNVRWPEGEPNLVEIKLTAIDSKARSSDY
jgi:hypothetical protein